MTAWTAVTVSVADMSAVRRLWVDLFGLEVLLDRPGHDPAFAAAMGARHLGIRHQLKVATPGASFGHLHFVQFESPGTPVRHNAQNFDLCAKNLDVYVTDMPERVRELKAAGLTFRNDIFSEVTAPNGVRFREIHLPAHDEINVVLLELLDSPMHFSPQGYAGIGALVTIVADPDAEAAFYAATMGFAPVANHQLSGPEIEAMIGLPSGACLDIRILGQPGEHLGQIEIINYQGLAGHDLYPAQRAPATGILGLQLETLPEAGLKTPAGFQLVRQDCFTASSPG